MTSVSDGHIMDEKGGGVGARLATLPSKMKLNATGTTQTKTLDC